MDPCWYRHHQFVHYQDSFLSIVGALVELFISLFGERLVAVFAERRDTLIGNESTEKDGASSLALQIYVRRQTNGGDTRPAIGTRQEISSVFVARKKFQI